MYEFCRPNLYGVFEDIEVSDTVWDDVRGLWEPLGSFTKNQSEIRIHFKDYGLLGAVYGLQDTKN